MVEPIPGPQPVPSLGVGGDTNVSVNVLSQMPNVQGKNALCFQGKHILDFLMQYEHIAKQANLTDEKKCQELSIYFAKKEKCCRWENGSLCIPPMDTSFRHWNTSL